MSSTLDRTFSNFKVLLINDGELKEFMLPHGLVNRFYELRELKNRIWRESRMIDIENNQNINGIHRSVENSEVKKHVVAISSVSFCLIVVFAFTSHFILTILSGKAYCVFLGLLTLAYVFQSRIWKEQTNPCFVLIFLVVIISFVGYLRGRSYGTLIDIITLFCGYLLVRIHGNESYRYYGMLKIITFLVPFMR